ncbi:MAG: hypothetical protein K2W85_02270 [Phycisphaerales bacterium]|nr:hypothetical protein [Phycisphaerales bacterium]
MGLFDFFRRVFRRAQQGAGGAESAGGLRGAREGPKGKSLDAKASGAAGKSGDESKVVEEPPEWAPYFQTAERYERFDGLIREYFRRRNRRALIVDGMLKVAKAPNARVEDQDDFEGEFGLGNLSQVCAQAPIEQWGEIIARHFDGVMRISSANKDAPAPRLDEVREKLCIRLWDMTTELVRAHAVWREQIPGLASVICVDEPESIRTLRAEDAEGWGLESDELFRIALENLQDLAPVETASHDLPDGMKLHEIFGDSFFSATWILRDDVFDRVAGKLGVFFAVPTRHRILAMPFDNPESLKTLSNLMLIATGMERDGPGSISPRVYWRHEGRTLEIEYSISESTLNVRPPESLVRMLEELGGA